MLKDYDTVVDIKIPERGRLTVVGDLHGQLDDLLTIFKHNGIFYYIFIFYNIFCFFFYLFFFVFFCFFLLYFLFFFF